MKIFVLIAGIALGIFLVARLQQPARNTPAASVPAVPVSTTATAVAAAPAPAPSALRRPIAKTQAVLKEVEARTGAGEF
jgi:hypothetical protein